MGCSCSINTDKHKLVQDACKQNQINPLTLYRTILAPNGIIRSSGTCNAESWLASKECLSVPFTHNDLSSVNRSHEISLSNLHEPEYHEKLLTENSAEESKVPKPIVRYKKNNSKAKCYNGHILKLSLNKTISWICYYCSLGNELGNPYHCSICDFFLCLYCYMWISNHRKVLPEYIRCPEDHPLRVTPIRNVTEFYISTNKTHNISCMSCGGDLVEYETLNHCRLCKFDLCNACVLYIEEVKGKTDMKCEQNHPLIWQIERAHNCTGFTCTNCKQYFKMLGSFGCKECNFHFCVRCSMLGLNLE